MRARRGLAALGRRREERGLIEQRGVAVGLVDDHGDGAVADRPDRALVAVATLDQAAQPLPRARLEASEHGARRESDVEAVLLARQELHRVARGEALQGAGVGPVQLEDRRLARLLDTGVGADRVAARSLPRPVPRLAAFLGLALDRGRLGLQPGDVLARDRVGGIDLERAPVGRDRGREVVELRQRLAEAVRSLDVVGLLLEQRAVLLDGEVPAPLEGVGDGCLDALLPGPLGGLNHVRSSCSSGSAGRARHRAAGRFAHGNAQRDSPVIIRKEGTLPVCKRFLDIFQSPRPRWPIGRRVAVRGRF